MIKKHKKIKYPVHEHLEHWVTQTTYKQRLQWLEEANGFVQSLQKKKDYPNRSRKS